MVVAVKASGSWRYPKEISVKSGGAWRSIKGCAVNDGGSWYKTSLITTFTVSTLAFTDYYGYLSGQGSVANAVSSDGTRIYEIYYRVSANQTHLLMQARNEEWSNALTQSNYYRSASVGGTTVLMSSASAFGYSPAGPPSFEYGDWTFSGDVFGLAAKAGTAVSLQITLA